MLALVGDHEQSQHCQGARGDDAGDIQGSGGEHGCNQRANAHCPSTKKCGLRNRFLHKRAKLFGFTLAVILVDNGFDGRADAIDQLAAAFRLGAGAGRHCPLGLCLPAFQRACHLVPDIEVLIHQPVDQAADFSVDLFRHICLDFRLELGFDLVRLGKVKNSGQFHGVVKVILPAVFKAVEDIFNFSQSGRQLSRQLIPIVCQHSFQRS